MSVAESKECDGDNEFGIGNTVNFKPGQTKGTPAMGAGDRVFYETLLEQTPSSEMAQEWCVQYGVLEWERAQKLHLQICKRKGKPVPTNIKKPTTPSSTTTAKKSSIKTKSTKKRKADQDITTDTGFEASGEFEGIGISSI
jgi:hypothetical protein